MSPTEIIEPVLSTPIYEVDYSALKEIAQHAFFTGSVLSITVILTITLVPAAIKVAKKFIG